MKVSKEEHKGRRSEERLVLFVGGSDSAAATPTVSSALQQKCRYQACRHVVVNVMADRRHEASKQRGKAPTAKLYFGGQ